MTSLQKALSTNAFFSGLSGLVLIAAHQRIAALFALSGSTPFWTIGIALLFFAATIVLEVVKQRPLPVWWIITQDLLWVAGSFFLLLLQPFGISETGRIIIASVACIVLIMAIWQSVALLKLYKTQQK